MDYKKFFEDVEEHFKKYRNDIIKGLRTKELTKKNVIEYLDDVDNICMALCFDNIKNIVKVIYFFDCNNLFIHGNTLDSHILFLIVNGGNLMGDYYYYDLTGLSNYKNELYNMLNLKKISLMGKTYKYTFENDNGELLDISL
jgi:hypothetical protein